MRFNVGSSGAGYAWLAQTGAVHLLGSGHLQRANVGKALLVSAETLV